MEFLALPAIVHDLPSIDFGESGIEFGVPVLDHRIRDLLPLLLKEKQQCQL